MMNAAARPRAASGIVTRRSTPSAPATVATAANASAWPLRAKWSSATAIRSPSIPCPSIGVAASTGQGHCAGSRRVVALQRVPGRGQVGHGAGERAQMVDVGDEHVAAGAGEPAEGRLQAEDAAQAGRDPDRAVGVAAERERHEPAGDGGAAAARRAAGRAAEVVRIVARPVMRVLGREAVGIFVHVEGTDADGASRLHPLDEVGVGRRRRAGPARSSSRRR